MSSYLSVLSRYSPSTSHSSRPRSFLTRSRRRTPDSSIAAGWAWARRSTSPSSCFSSRYSGARTCPGISCSRRFDLGATHAERLRTMLDSGDPGDAADYPCFLYVLHVAGEQRGDVMLQAGGGRTEGQRQEAAPREKAVPEPSRPYPMIGERPPTPIDSQKRLVATVGNAILEPESMDGPCSSGRFPGDIKMKKLPLLGSLLLAATAHATTTLTTSIGFAGSNVMC